MIEVEFKAYLADLGITISWYGSLPYRPMVGDYVVCDRDAFKGILKVVNVIINLDLSLTATLGK